MKLLEVEAKKGQLPCARVEIAKQMKGGVSRQSVWVYDGTELTEDRSGLRRTDNLYRIPHRHHREDARWRVDAIDRARRWSRDARKRSEICRAPAKHASLSSWPRC
ncbi:MULTISPECIES: hypothetical protein [unclassified Sphingobium]|uniref:hypothetical protein n=1 Tax=unclassified Sphingobium TaxID=2611147 RepID=UPI0005CBE0A8|nr:MULTISPECIES: hypothetical protein [unclassified Sphingobium]AJR24372.1 hypothetical protein TZ53_12170 [Sphingobium sp. YBL2]AMK16774.1 hypothetical protein K663_01915 [Sphingobium sp. MI1205]